MLREGGGLPQGIESEDRAPVVGEVHVQFLRWVIVRHEREDRGHDEARWLRLRICCADEDVHAGQPVSIPAPDCSLCGGQETVTHSHIFFSCSSVRAT